MLYVRYHFCLQVLLDKQDTDNPEQVYAAAIALGFERRRRASETEFQYKEAFVIELVKVLGFERVAGQLVSAMGTAGAVGCYFTSVRGGCVAFNGDSRCGRLGRSAAPVFRGQTTLETCSCSAKLL